MKKILLAVIITLTFSSQVFAQSGNIVDTATLKIVAKEVTTANTTTLRLTLNNTLNRKPQSDCKYVLFAIFSDVGVTDSETKRYKILTRTLKKGSPKTFSLSYSGAAIDGDAGDQRQGTFQAVVTCGLEDPVFSTLAAANLTCDGGLTQSKFIRALKSRIK